MRYIIFAAIILLMTFGALSPSNASDGKGATSSLEDAYQKEILFLSTYKKELVEKNSRLKKTLGEKAELAKAELQQLEERWLRLQSSNENLLQKAERLERESERKTEYRDGVQDILAQGALAFDLEWKNEKVSPEKIKMIFERSRSVLAISQSTRRQAGSYFDDMGRLQEGQILFVGRVGRFAEVGPNQYRPLYPTGEGHFRVWSKGKVQTFGNAESQVFPKMLSLFIFDDPDNAFQKPIEKTWKSTLVSGGLIGWVIVVLGFLALVLSLLRYQKLRQARVQDERDLIAIVKSVENRDLVAAQTLCLERNDATTRVVGKTLVALQKNPDGVEDVIVEGIVAESQIIDRYGVFILVIASVAPLLGLLGTVTGMISTFDIITQFGTGNPKLLSGGISEALVTTMFGLIVAIPALLVGQYLGAMNENIKADMEKWALAISNGFASSGVDKS